MAQNLSYYVKGGNTFGYLLDSPAKSFFVRMAVLAVSVPDGGDPLLLDKTIVVRQDQIRPATDADFEKFRICK